MFYCFALARLAYQGDKEKRFEVHKEMSELIRMKDKEWVTRAIENYLVGGKMDIRLLPILITNKEFFRVMMETFRYYFQIKLLGIGSIRPHNSITKKA